MRLLFTTSPLVGHVLPLVSLAWAALTAGHEVVVATAGDAVGAARDAGLTACDLADGQDLMNRFTRPQAPASSDGARGTAEAMVVHLFGTCGAEMADAAISFAADWRPDCIVHSALDGAGPLAARARGIPLVRHTFGMGPTAQTLVEGVWQRLEPLRRRHGIDDDPVAPIGVIDPGPRSLRESTPDEVLPCRLIPFNGGGTLPGWLHGATGPRLCVTLGTVLPGTSGSGTYGKVLAAVGDLDAEVVVLHGRGAPPAVGPVPAHVRFAGYVPLAVLLPTCAALVHHGGSGTAATALALGVPQLALPHMADQFDVAAVLRRCGVGLVEMPDESTADGLRAATSTLLRDAELRSRAAEVARENADLPGPAQVVAELAARVAAR